MGRASAAADSAGADGGGTRGGSTTFVGAGSSFTASGVGEVSGRAVAAGRGAGAADSGEAAGGAALSSGRFAGALRAAAALFRAGAGLGGSVSGASAGGRLAGASRLGGAKGALTHWSSGSAPGAAEEVLLRPDAGAVDDRALIHFGLTGPFADFEAVGAAAFSPPCAAALFGERAEALPGSPRAAGAGEAPADAGLVWACGGIVRGPHGLRAGRALLTNVWHEKAFPALVGRRPEPVFVIIGHYA